MKHEERNFKFRIKLRHEEREPSCELERRGETEMDEEQTTDDLCLLHKGLAEFLIFEGIIFFKCGCFFCVGTEQKNKPTLDLRKLRHEEKILSAC